MGLIIKVILAILVIALAAAFFIEGKDGKPLLTLDELQQPDALPRIKDKVTDLVDEDNSRSAGSKDKIYRWRDEEGNLHFSNIEPVDKSAVKTVEVDPGVNVIGSDDPDTPNSALLPVPPAEDEESAEESPKMIRVYNPEAGN
jgi:hypothetical protein